MHYMPQETCMLIHSEEKSFRFELCDHYWTRAEYLINYKLIHAGEKLYACKQCNYSSIRSDELRNGGECWWISVGKASWTGFECAQLDLMQTQRVYCTLYLFRSQICVYSTWMQTQCVLLPRSSCVCLPEISKLCPAFCCHSKQTAQQGVGFAPNELRLTIRCALI